MCVGNLCGLPVGACPFCGGIVDIIHGIYLTFSSLALSAVTGMYIAFKEKVNLLLSKILLMVQGLI